MKKYLMTGMAAIAFCAAFTSCSKNEDLYDPDYQSKAIIQTYNDAFIKVFGQPSANQDWGFGSASTRTALTNNNQWFVDQPTGYGLEKPADLSAEEIEYVMNWFSQKRTGHGETLDLNYYFVQQVAYGNKDNQGVTHNISGQVFETFRNGEPVYRTENYTVNSKEHMDWIAANMKANVQSEADCDHVNNFNTGSGSLMLMGDSETQYGFAFKDSWGTEDNLVSTNYYMVHLVADYKGKHIDGWYVGFDYQTSKKEMGVIDYSVNPNKEYPDMVKSSVKLDPDGIYNDRVVKIVPAGEKPHNYTICVIGEDLTVGGDDVEDLGADFDFNDVVFDVALEANETWVRLKAAGGTLPLYIDGIEVHGKFGVATNVMVNTGAGPNKSYVEFKLNNVYTDAKAIPVVVTKGGRSVELKAVMGEPASKIGVKTNYVWCGERVGVVDQYPQFKTWVTTNPKIEWY